MRAEMQVRWETAVSRENLSTTLERKEDGISTGVTDPSRAEIISIKETTCSSWGGRDLGSHPGRSTTILGVMDARTELELLWLGR